MRLNLQSLLSLCTACCLSFATLRFPVAGVIVVLMLLPCGIFLLGLYSPNSGDAKDAWAVWLYRLLLRVFVLSLTLLVIVSLAAILSPRAQEILFRIRYGLPMTS